MRTWCVRALISVVGLVLSVLLLGCGGGGSAAPKVFTPTITSTPVTTATEGAAYSYTLSASDPSGGAVSYSLTTAPSGATLTGNTVSWTPTSAQARRSNDFVVTAKTVSGGSATQSWTVAPNGTVHVAWIDTHWTADGATLVPRDLSSPQFSAVALVPQPDGSMVSLTGTGGADGNLTIANVPAGYYWLQVSNVTLYRTSSSDVDLGTDYNQPVSILSAPLGTPTERGTLNLHGVDPVTDGRIEIYFEPGFGIIGTTTALGSFPIHLFVPQDLDLTAIKKIYVLEYEPTALGNHAGFALGPAALPDVSLTNEGPNLLDFQLESGVAKSVDLRVKGSAWDPLFVKVAPTSPTRVSTQFGMMSELYVASPEIKVQTTGRAVRLFGPKLVVSDPFGNSVGSHFQGLAGASMDCAPAPTLGFSMSSDVIGDEDLGIVDYHDPFPAEWTRYFSVCQQASVDFTLSDGSSLAYFLTNGLSTSTPASPVVPLIGPVLNPTINDSDLFTAATVSAKNYTVKWNKPSVGTASSYSVRVLNEATRTNRDGSTVKVLLPIKILWTTDTNLTVPSGTLEAGKKYLFQITAVSDARSKVETSPNRNGIPRGVADVVSAWITIGQ